MNPSTRTVPVSLDQELVAEHEGRAGSLTALAELLAELEATHGAPDETLVRRYTELLA